MPTPEDCSRRSMLIASGFVGLGAVTALARQRPEEAQPAEEQEGFPQTPPALVQAVVGASHRDLAKVRALVEERPSLAGASWDWGFGDWETALGAASHTGRREIALFLMEHGARPDIFTFAMLGNLAAVRAIVEANPGVQRIHGPHGIPLLRHAIAGGDQAADVAEYLRSLGDAGREYDNQPLPLEASAYTGEYRVAPTGRTQFQITEVKGELNVQSGDKSRRRLFHVGENVFHPAGAPAVRLTFEIVNGRAGAVTILDGRSLRAVRAS